MQKHLSLVHIQQLLLMLYDEYIFHHKNNHLHDNVQLYMQEYYHDMSKEHLKHLHNSIIMQLHHQLQDELEYDL